jgi:hypothetical protein
MINTKDFLKSDKASEFDVSFTDKEWVAIKTWMKEYANEQLLLHNVSQHRELLLAWEEQKYFDFDWAKNKEMVTAKIDKYLANNCG